MEFLKDYDYIIQYHPGKANVVAEALRRNESVCMVGMMVSEWELVKAFHLMIVGVTSKGNSIYVASLTVQSKMIADMASPS